MATRRVRREVRQLLAVLSIVLMAAAGVAYATGTMTTAAEDLGELLLALLAAGSAALAWWATAGRLRRSWGALSLACLSWALGEALWSWYELVGDTETPFPSLADLGFLGFPVGAMVALAVFPGGASRADRRRMVLDGLMVASAFALISWDTALGAVVEAGGDSAFALAVSLAYPLLDLGLLVFCVLVLSRSRAYRWPLGLVAGGLALLAFADSGFAFLEASERYQGGGVIDLGWFLAFGVLALAPLTRSATHVEPPSGSVMVGGTALPYVPLAAAMLLLGAGYATGEQPDSVEAVLAAAIVSLVLLRQYLTVHDNKQLAEALSEREAELRHQAFHDGLTGLANRALYVDRVSHALELHRRDQRPLAICFVDLDGFKAINDTRGHAAGDELLRQVAERFQQALSEADTLARLGGDEFAVLLEDRVDAMRTARALLTSLSAPFLLDGREVVVLASVGVAKVQPTDPTPSVDELLSRADIAMYVVKRGGKADVLLHTPGLQLDEVEDVALGRSLAEALERQSVELAYQPVVSLTDGRIACLEALVRWYPGGSSVPAPVVVRVAERCHLMEALFRRVLSLACAQLARWSALPGGAQVSVSVNLSAGQLSSRELPQLVAAELGRHGLGGDRLVLEITETEGLEEGVISLAVCQELRQLGVRLSIDDFGVGLSSLTRLRELPVDEVKIDRSFIAGVDSQLGSRRFVRGVLAFAEQVDLTVVAEGVEREAERQALAELGCRLAQGFLFSRPVPPEAVDELLAGGWQRWHPGVPDGPVSGRPR